MKGTATLRKHAAVSSLKLALDWLLTIKGYLSTAPQPGFDHFSLIFFWVSLLQNAFVLHNFYV